MEKYHFGNLCFVYYFKGNIEYEIFGINWYLMVLIITESILVHFLIKYNKNFI